MGEAAVIVAGLGVLKAALKMLGKAYKNVCGRQGLPQYVKGERGRHKIYLYRKVGTA